MTAEIHVDDYATATPKPDTPTATDGAADEKPKRSQATILLELAGDAELFHTPDGDAYADITVNGHRETWPVRSRGFKRWLTHLYYQKTGGAPNADALSTAMGALEAKAHFEDRSAAPTCAWLRTSTAYTSTWPTSPGAASTFFPRVGRSSRVRRYGSDVLRVCCRCPAPVAGAASGR